MSQIPASQRRRRGAQLGNLNALRNGRFTTSIPLEDMHPADPLQLDNITSSIAMLKKLMLVAYQAGLKSTTLSETNETLRILSMASMSLSRLVNLQQCMAKVPLSKESDPVAK